MKVKESLLLSLLMSVGQLGFAQSDRSARNTETAQFKPSATPSPLVVLKSDERTLTLDPKKNETFNFDAIEPRWIKSITVLKDDKAKAVYGDQGDNGVLIIQLVDNYLFSKAALVKFKPED